MYFDCGVGTRSCLLLALIGSFTERPERYGRFDVLLSFRGGLFGRFQIVPQEELFETSHLGTKPSLAFGGLGLCTSDSCPLPLDEVSFRLQFGERLNDEVMGRTKLFQARDGRLTATRRKFATGVLDGLPGEPFMLCMAPKNLPTLAQRPELCGLEILLCRLECLLGCVQLHPAEEVFDAGLLSDELLLALRGFRWAAVFVASLAAFSFCSQLSERASDEVVSRMEAFEARKCRLMVSRHEFAPRVLHG